ncbi:hypothetical protein FQN54_004036 [Arachnomyces sp. PD_36]|nr:hypothetical protein FQN54_004036 [Arachnomyces sp. PD_36]
MPLRLSNLLAIAFSSFVISPFLLVCAFPLFIGSVVSVALSFAGLFSRVSFVYFELLLALARNYIFGFPDRSSYPKQVEAPGDVNVAPTRSYASGIRRRQQYHPLHIARTISPSRDTQEEGVWRRRSAGLVEGSTTTQRPKHALHRQKASLSLPTAFHALMSGDRNRDFEGIGGWRTQFPLKRNLQIQSSPASPGAETDDTVWTSFNRRLELPSIPSPYSRRSSLTASSHGLRLSVGSAEEDAEGGGGDGRTWIPSSPLQSPGLRRRHHRRSVTTSALLYHPNKSNAPHHPQQHEYHHPQQPVSSGSRSVSWQTPHRGAQSKPHTKTAPAHVRDTEAEGYFALEKGTDGFYVTTPYSVENANVGKSMKRTHRHTLSAKKPL